MPLKRLFATFIEYSSNAPPLIRKKTENIYLGRPGFPSKAIKPFGLVGRFKPLVSVPVHWLELGESIRDYGQRAPRRAPPEQVVENADSVTLGVERRVTPEDVHHGAMALHFQQCTLVF